MIKIKNRNTLAIKLLILIVVFSLSSNTSFAQQSLLESTLKTAKQYRDNGDFGEAARTLSDFNQQFPQNNWVLRLYAETLFWMKEYQMSNDVYLEALEIYPDDYDIMYEYSIMLFDWGKYQGTIDILDVYIKKYDNVSGAYSLLGISNYYLGNFKEAEKFLAKAKQLNPDDNKTNEVYGDVFKIVKPWVNVGVSYNTDSQPLSSFTPELQAGWYQSHALNPSIVASIQNFSSDTLSSSFIDIKLKNYFIFPKAGLSGSLSAGAYTTSLEKNPSFTWAVDAKQRLIKHLFIAGSAENTPYVFTPFSVASTFMTHKYNASLEWQNGKKWNVKAGYIAEAFPDSNNIQTAYVWFLSPAINLSVFEFYIGYAFSYAESKESRYTPKQSLNDIITNFSDTTKIDGWYNPYFTPHSQLTNSILFNAVIKPNKNINIKLHSAIGFFSKALNPYIYLDLKPSGKIFIKTDYYEETYTPLDLGMDFNVSLTEKLSLRLSYSYIQTFYFNTNNLSLNLKLYF